MLAAVDRQCGAGDEAGVLGGQEGDTARDLLRMAQAPDRDPRDNLLQHIARYRADHFGIDVARRNRVYGDAESRTLLRQRLGEPVDARLGGRVVDLAILPGLAVDAADIDDPPELGGTHRIERP